MMKYSVWYTSVFAILGMFTSKQVEAHVKWFVSQNGTGIDKGNDVYFSFLNPNMKIVLGIAILTFICAAIIHICLSRYAQQPSILTQKLKTQVIVLAQLLTGSAFFASSINGVLFAPHFTASPNQIIFLMMELVAGILFISRSYIYLASFLTIIIFIVVTIDYGFVSSFEYLNLVGLVSLFSLSYLAVRPPKKRTLIEPFNKESLTMLGLTFYRITLGIALVVLGLSEKLLNPELALNFVNQYPEFNFMQALGLDFSNRLFVLCGGVAEVLFGMIYIVGFVPRINTLALAVFLIASNSFFAFTGELDKALMELTGHLPLLAGAIMLVILGGGYSYSALKPFVSFQWRSLRVNT